MPDFLRVQLERETDPATPPWLTVRMWLAVSAIACSVVVLVMGHA